jgi:hypothetical protein
MATMPPLPPPTLLLLLLLLLATPHRATVGVAAASLCAHARAGTDATWVNGELVAHWQVAANSGDDHLRLLSTQTRPLLAAALFGDPGMTPNEKPLPKEVVFAAVQLNAVTTIDEKNGFFEGDGELVLTWYDERLCFNASHWQATPDPDCHCDSIPCTCVFLRGAELVDFTQWVWVPEATVKALALRYTTGEHSLAHQEQRLTVSSQGNVTWHRRFVEQFPTGFNESKMPFDDQTLSVSVGSFAATSGPSAETHLRWAAAGGDLRADGGGALRLPTGWGIYECPPGVDETGCLHAPTQECSDGACDLAAHLLISRKYNSYFCKKLTGRQPT